MNKKIRLTEGDLRRIVRESINRVLTESDGGVWDAIDIELGQVGDVRISRFYSDDNQVTVAVNRVVGGDGKRVVVGIMKKFGYEYYDAGGNGEYVMMTFNKVG